VQPGNATNKTVTWSSGNNARAIVSPEGMVSIPAAATAGEVTITVTTADGSKTANCTVTVSVPVTGITISGDATVEAGRSVNIDGLGTFRLSFSSKGVDKPEDFNANMISGLKVIFTPRTELRDKIKSVKYTKA